MKYERGGALLETALFTPFLILLLVGMTELGRITYTHYTLQKMMYTLARFLGTQQGVNFCSADDATIAAAKNYALTGSLETGAPPILTNLTADMIQVRIERYNPQTAELAECECAASLIGCDTGGGARAPDFIVVSLPDGYSVTPAIPYLNSQVIALRPVVRVPYGGT
ncbi:MAG TPA: TadE family protein [Bryobacteraceae bacterium]|nr:TadE family protein [Bryobacteraceae bacterium]